MHVAEKGEGPLILFLHGFPDLWYSWRHQITALAALGYRALAPDLRGYGGTDAPDSVSDYTCFHVVGDLIVLLDAVAPEDKVFVVGHDWGAIIAWDLCLFRPDRVKALFNLSVPFIPYNPRFKPVETWKAFFGNDHYIVRFQEPGVMEAEFAEIGVGRAVLDLLSYRVPDPLLLPKGNLFGHPPDAPVDLPPWMSQQDADYYATQFEKTGITGALNYYRNFDRNWELSAPWWKSEIKVPVKFVMGDLDLVYTMPGMKDYIHKGGFKRDVPLLEEALVIEGVTHWIHLEIPDQINQLMFHFFSKFH
ncbi:lipoamide acyltransferase component of branched-chain alpha-keto acid dehydrogenase complex [Hibiscus syriacus]|uniref:soluble epoxide hydrolase n=2 Tax=Hibiscus syriacus TaxID=106335 RepID=A0A6A2XQR8_HIBSY|nr:lipoamide acyltransferase component of branched-chain alpha-keto acid dehydrogenase complex [Hibiscus syriacus]